MRRGVRLRRAAVPLALALSLPILAAGAVALPPSDGQPSPQDPELAAQQRAVNAQREALFEDTPPVPDAIRGLSRAKFDMLTPEVHDRLHDASAQALEEAELSLLTVDPRLELLLIPETWTSTHDALEFVEGLGSGLEITAFHIAFPGQERTTLGIIERIDGSDWPSTLATWHGFFTTSMEENQATTHGYLEEPDETDDQSMTSSRRRYLEDVRWMLESSKDGRYPVYALRLMARKNIEDQEWDEIVQLLRSEDFGGFLIPKRQVPAALSPPEDPIRDATILDERTD